MIKYISILFAGLALFALQVFQPHLVLAASSEKEILSNLKSEESKADNRKTTLSRLNGQERSLHTNLAATEDRILNLEKNLAEQREKLRGLARSGEAALDEYEGLLKEKNKSEQAMREVLRTLWELDSRKQSVGGRDLEEWTVTDREYYWSADLFDSLEQYRALIKEQEEQLDAVTARRNAVSRDIMEAMAVIEEEKGKILADRLKYEQQLALVRKQKQDAQAELNAAIKLIANLNFDLKTARQAALDIDKAKGMLAWPADGKIALRYKPSASPPVQGLGIATASGATVQAVHAGKVMYNDTMRGLGQVVVVQHGSAYFTVYAFLSESNVTQGQTVARGQKLGKAGYYPAIKSSGVYFELRYHQKPVDPAPWLAKNS
ncbi:MAG: peptidoglycan DD-metalloendopeptidase family protein [Deltaproteobacteria bacterium]|nr:peptidoglycan DD-metalloendopeptidase family protein [Deltaproteobacteria bacterium]